MPRINVKNHGNRLFSQAPDGITNYWFRTYFSEGMHNAWFLDIYNSQMVELETGIPLVPGTVNLLKGTGDKFPEGTQLTAVLTEGSEQDPDALGNGLYLWWTNPGEENPFKIGDPLIDPSSTNWVFGGDDDRSHALLTDRFIPDQHDIPAIRGLQDALDAKASIEQLAQKLDDAPRDNKAYGRKNGEWVEIDEREDSVIGQTLYFQGDGYSLTHTVMHDLNTEDVIARTYKHVTGEAIEMQDVAYYSNRIVFRTDAPLSSGLVVRAVVVGVNAEWTGGGGGEPVDGRKEYVHQQEADSMTWSITHSLGTQYPRVLTMDENGGEIAGSPDYDTSTNNYISIEFALPVSGMAVLTN